MADINRNCEDYKRIFARIEKAVAAIPARVAVLAVNFSKDRFVKKNWYDITEKRWKASRKKKGSTLVASGRLKRSIRKISVKPTQVIFGTDVPYARIHNEGGTINGTEQVRSHTRRQHRRRSYRRKGKVIKAQTVKAYRVKSFSRKYNRKFAKRQFIGKSRELDRRIDNLSTNEINRAIKG